MKHDMVIFGEDWGRHPSSTQHLVKRLAGERSMLWVNSIGMRRPRLNREDMHRLFQKAHSMTMKHLVEPVRENSNVVPENMRVLSPVAIPLPGSPLAARFNKKALSSQIRKEMKSAKISNPILWCSLPTAVVACDTLDERSVIYYCGDDFNSWQGVDHEPVMEAERRLVERADLVIASSQHLTERFPREKTMLIEHGVDHDIFSTPAPRPEDMQFNGPIAGFFGSIGDRIHVDLIAQAAKKLPNWHFVMIGPIQTDCSRLQACKNVHFLGERKHEELAGYVQNWDVSLLPFRQGPDMDASNPLKMREYFAAGTPVVATRFKALKRYEQLVRIAEDENGFTRAIEKALHDKQYNQLRRDFVAHESWDAQANKIESVIETL